LHDIFLIINEDKYLYVLNIYVKIDISQNEN
jgi:hypothetical protein